MTATSTSLLGRLHAGADDAAWRRLVELYTPLIAGWLRRLAVAPQEADDLVQEVFCVVLKRLPEFQHNQRTGAFRAWLRAIAINCAREFWRARRIRPTAPGGDDFDNYLDQLADPTNALSRQWDYDHDQFITRRLLELLQPQFEASTWRAFQRAAVDGEPAAVVAAELGISVNAVFIAKSRVIARLREEAIGLIDL